MFFGVVSGSIGHVLQKRAMSPRHEMQRAMEAAEFIPYFQPVVHGNSKQWSGCEVLMRWNHPKEGLVRPDLFIPFAEYSGLIVPMTRSLMRQTAALLRPCPRRSKSRFTLASTSPPAIARTWIWWRIVASSSRLSHRVRSAWCWS